MKTLLESIIVIVPDLQYLRARYYDPNMGRFMQQDTLFGEMERPLTQNLYIYCLNNGVNLRDPSGNSSVAELQAQYDRAQRAGAGQSVLDEIKKAIERARKAESKPKPNPSTKPPKKPDWGDTSNPYNPVNNPNSVGSILSGADVYWSSGGGSSNPHTQELITNGIIDEESKKSNVPIDLSKTTYMSLKDYKNKVTALAGCKSSSRTYVDNNGILRVMRGDTKDVANDYYAVAMPDEVYNQTFTILQEYFEFDYSSSANYRGYEYRFNLVDERGNRYSFNAMGFDAKAAKDESPSWLFPIDGIGNDNPQTHDHLVEFVIGSGKPQGASIGYNYVLQLLFGSDLKLSVDSIEMYISKPLVQGTEYKGAGYREFK